MTTSNQQAFKEAKHYIAGGVNSPVRSFMAVGGTPFFVTGAKGCYLHDIEGRNYIDYVCSWGANLLGHAHEGILLALQNALHDGLSYGAPTLKELNFAKLIHQLMPAIEQVRLVSSGTEAVMSAIRLARGYTKKEYIVKFTGCYHGHSDSMLVKAGSGVATFANAGADAKTINTNNGREFLPTTTSSEGVPHAIGATTLVCNYNDSAELTSLFDHYGDNIAAVIVEPFAGNMNLVKPFNSFINTIATLCKDYGSLLIFDEVMTGFRVALGGASTLLNITPDLTILGKVIGGGLPLALFGGKSAIMNHLAPIGGVYQAGTLSGNPIAVSAGLSALQYIMQDTTLYETLAKKSCKLVNGLIQIAKNYNIPFSADYVGGMFGFYFMNILPHDFASVSQANLDHFKQFFHGMLAHGIFFAPSMYEAGFICMAHSDDVINRTLECANQVMSQIH